MSGINLVDGRVIRKGVYDSIIKRVKEFGGIVLEDLEENVNWVVKLGGIFLVVCVDNEIYGIIYLKDIVKLGFVERFVRFWEIGIKIIMCIGDNFLIVVIIVREVGVDGFIVECKLEDKIDVIKKE